jgi:hypothetical protein
LFKAAQGRPEPGGYLLNANVAMARPIAKRLANDREMDREGGQTPQIWSMNRQELRAF